MDELWGCCGQLLATNHKYEHTLCDGEEEPYRVGGLSIRLEKCPHPGCRAQFYSSPTQNLQHQDSVHHGVLAYVCRACRGIYVRGPLCAILSTGTMGQWDSREI